MSKLIEEIIKVSEVINYISTELKVNPTDCMKIIALYNHIMMVNPFSCKIEEVEKGIISKALMEHKTIANAAKSIGWSERTLYRKIRDYDIIRIKKTRQTKKQAQL